VTVTDGAPGAEWAAAAAAASDTDAATGLWAVGNLACVDAAAREACLHTPRLPARLGELLSAAAAAAATAAPGAGAGAGAGVAAAAAAAIRNLTAGGGAAGGGLLGAVPGLVASLAALAVVAEERALRADEAGAAAAHSVPGAGAGEAAPGDGVAERAWEEVSHALGALCNLTTAVPGNVRPPAPLHSLLPHSHRATRPPPSRARRRSSRFTLSRRPPPLPVQSGHVSSIPPY
jgi:DNA polymerase-3 subunit gamma/tau